MTPSDLYNLYIPYGQYMSIGVLCQAYAVFLTNNPIYWRPPSGAVVGNATYRLHEGRQIQPGFLAWGASEGKGTIAGRERSIHLNGTYTPNWIPYSSVEGMERGEFRYLMVEVAEQPWQR